MLPPTTSEKDPATLEPKKVVVVDVDKMARRAVAVRAISTRRRLSHLASITAVVAEVAAVGRRTSRTANVTIIKAGICTRIAIGRGKRTVIGTSRDLYLVKRRDHRLRGTTKRNATESYSTRHRPRIGIRTVTKDKKRKRSSSDGSDRRTRNQNREERPGSGRRRGGR